MISLRQRLNRGLIFILFVIFAVHWFAADWVIRTVAEKQMMTRLEHDSDSIFDAIKHSDFGELHFENYRIPLVYDQPYSGHYFILQIDKQVYLSGSLQNQTLAVQAVPVGEARHYYLTGPENQPLLVLGCGIIINSHIITLTIAEDLTEIGKDILHIRLIYLLVTVVVWLLAIFLQTADVKRSMQPLRRVEEELGQIADGQRQQIAADVPAEIRSLVKEINRLITLIQRRLLQSRTAIGNLAHSLKTPLAVMVRVSENPELHAHPELQALLVTQTQAIENRIARELKRARLAGHIQSGASFNALHEVTTLAKLLKNVYTEKRLKIIVSAPDRMIPFDREDVLEIIGNLADNACIWAKTTVNIVISYQTSLVIQIEDDGPGCPEHQLQQLVQRGVRLDEKVQGHGLGLAIVNDVVEFYGGTMSLASGVNLGGLLATIRF